MTMVFGSPRSYMLLSVAAAVATIVLKTWAWRLTGSVGLLSDAMESGVNLVAALGAFWALTLAAKSLSPAQPITLKVSLKGFSAALSRIGELMK